MIESFPLGKAVGDRAAELFTSGLNCAESVLQANMEYFKVEGDWFPRVATGFGAGIAQAGLVGGVVTGAVMAAGWVLGRDTPTESSDELYALLAEFMGDFARERGSITCIDLIGLDFSDPAMRARARQERLFETTCVPLVAYGAAHIAEMLSPQA